MATKFTSAQVTSGADILAAQENAMRLDMLKNAGDYATSTGSANAYVLALDAQITTYVAGDVFKFNANFANTGMATLNVNTIGAKTIKKNHDVALEAGDIESGQLVVVMYDGTDLQLLSPTGIELSSANKATLQGGSTSNADALHTHSLAELVSGSSSGSNITQAIHLDIRDGILAVSLTGTSTWLKQAGNILLNNGANDSAILYSHSIDNASAVAKAAIVAGLTLAHAATYDIAIKLANTTTYDFYVGFDGEAAGTIPTTGVHFGFFKDNAVVYATNGNGATATQTDITASITLGQWNDFKIIRGASDITFYVNGALVATHTTNLPASGTAALHIVSTDTNNLPDEVFIGRSLFVSYPKTI
jgi:hypothetical protein